MKKYLHIPACLFISIFLLQSCLKPKPETKYITVNESVKSGTIYSLDISKYAGKNSTATITTQAGEYKTSQLDWDAVNYCTVYHFSSEAKTAQQEKVVITAKDKGNGPCNNDDKKTVITLNFEVQQ